MNWAYFGGIALAPVMLLVMLLAARPLTNWIRRTLPDGRVKRILFFTW